MLGMLTKGVDIPNNSAYNEFMEVIYYEYQ